MDDEAARVSQSPAVPRRTPWYGARLWVLALLCLVAGFAGRVMVEAGGGVYAYPLAVEWQILCYGPGLVLMSFARPPWGAWGTGGGCGVIAALALASAFAVLTSIPK
jgi:hypothetical protein